MFENLTDKLDRAFKMLRGHGRVTEINIADTLKEVRRALLDADVGYKVAKEFTNKVKEKALGQDVIKSVQPGQLLIKLTHDELSALMGERQEDINLAGNPPVILLAGLQGSGKTTFAAKLSLFLKSKKGRRPLLVACDIYRPAAIEQLKVLGEQIGIEVFSDPDNKNAVDIAKQAIIYAQNNNFSTLIIDTAGRLSVDEEMMTEIAALKKEVKPSEILFVVDSMTGQDAVNTAKEFNDRLNFDGVVLTKLDGDTRGGAALSIRSVVNKPIKCISTGERLEALDMFYPDRMADRILGMGDVVSLVERAQEQIDEEESRKLQKKIAKNQFDFDDFLRQIRQIKKMGNMKDLLGMVPGMGKALKDVDIDDDAFKGLEAIIQSMTPQERKTPSLINGSRRQRIAAGSGSSIQEVNSLLKQFHSSSKMMKMMSDKQGMKNIMRQMKNRPGMH